MKTLGCQNGNLSMSNLPEYPTIQSSIALESYLEEVKIQLAEIKITKPKNKLPPVEREALKSLKHDTRKLI